MRTAFRDQLIAVRGKRRENGQLALAASHQGRQSSRMPDLQAAPTADPSATAALARELLELTARLGARVDEDPFGNPVLLLSLAITRRMDNDIITESDAAALIRYLRDAAFADRAARLGKYVGGIDSEA